MKQLELYEIFKAWFAHKTILSKTSKYYLNEKRIAAFCNMQTVFRDFEKLNKFEFSKRILQSEMALTSLVPDYINPSFQSSHDTLQIIFKQAKEIRHSKILPCVAGD